MGENIIIKGARVHNLKNIDVEIPKNKLVVFTGVSGSGKSSLAFDTIYAEGHRRYVESLSAYARQFLGVLDKPDVDLIEGLSPCISIDQKAVSHNPRSTVGTTTEIYDYLRLLFARIGHPHCPICGREISRQSPEQIVQQIIASFSGLVSKSGLRLFLLSPLVRGKKGEHSRLFENLKKQGFQWVRLDGETLSLKEDLILIKTNKHDIDVVVDRVVLDKASLPSPELKSRLFEGVGQSIRLSGGEVIVSVVEDASFDFPEHPQKLKDQLYSVRFACPVDNLSLPELEPRTFSFNSPYGACPTCTGLGYQLKISPEFILNPRLTLLEGAILPWSSLFTKDTWFSRLVNSVAGKHGIPLDEPVGQIPLERLNILLSGGGERLYEVSGRNRFGRLRNFQEYFEGIIPILERRYRETDSDFVRSEIGKYMIKESCPQCRGVRLRKEALSVTVTGKSVVEIAGLPISGALSWVGNLPNFISEREISIATPILKEIKARLEFLLDVGLDYLTLGRTSDTLAGGEAQRIRLASQIGSGLSGVIYVLDEPSIGLHARDQGRLIATLKNLRDIGNTVIVVEHDPQTIKSADYIIDFGPGAGEEGGRIVATGSLEKITKNQSSLTGQYLSGRKRIEIVPSSRKSPLNDTNTGKNLTLLGCTEHNLKNIDVAFPLGKFICVTGVSGSGKSTLINETLYRALRASFGLKLFEKPGVYRRIEGVEFIDRVINIDQSPIGRTPRSNPATYTGVFDEIRRIFAQTPEAKLRGYKPGRFSFNVVGGRCENCRGEGQIKIEMQFLADVYVDCEVCRGKRYNSGALEIDYKEKNISDVLELSVDSALSFFENFPPIRHKLQTLSDVGLGYIRLGQPAPTLSGGEAQRVKLSLELSKKTTGKTLYLLDEPTTGLHFDDLRKLLIVLRRLVDAGNTVVVIEHNLDVIKNSDWIIDLGPEGGEGGGEVVICGAVEKVVSEPKSQTGQELKKYLQAI